MTTSHKSAHKLENLRGNEDLAEWKSEMLLVLRSAHENWLKAEDEPCFITMQSLGPVVKVRCRDFNRGPEAN